ncbi:hypothetical protein Zm00014a_006244 [Zea mays]|uniref:Uncharacterized protein n=1 Tax=Zea mays TaxID=4577 RepID=A0A3L6ESK9_MAIZE|nr:hypothetical protein Zm00014a_006244 [Zea mays]
MGRASDRPDRHGLFGHL